MREDLIVITCRADLMKLMTKLGVSLEPEALEACFDAWIEENHRPMPLANFGLRKPGDSVQ